MTIVIDIQTFSIFFGIFFGIAFGLGLAFIPSLIKYVNEKRKARKAIFKDSMEILRTIRENEKNHYAIDKKQIKKLLENSMTPKKLCREFRNLEIQINEYNDWLFESDNIFKAEVESKVNKLKDKSKWGPIVNQLGSNLTTHISHLIHDGNLTLEATKEFLFQHWGIDYKVDNIRLREFVDSEDFYKLIDKLKDLEKRASLRMLRKTRKSLLSTVEDTTRWVQRRSKENITGDRETEFLQVQDLVQ